MERGEAGQPAAQSVSGRGLELEVGHGGRHDTPAGGAGAEAEVMVTPGTGNILTSFEVLF